MSYILKALERAERDQRARKGPSIHDRPARQETKGRRGYRLVLTLVLVNALLAGGLLWMLFPREDTPTVSLNAAEPVQVPVVSAAPPAPSLPATIPVQSAPLSELSQEGAKHAPAVAEISASNGPERQSETLTPLPPTSPQEPDIPAVYYDSYPGLRLTLHYFAKEKGGSLVRINDTMLRGPGPVDGEFYLKEILPDAVLLRHGNKEFYLNVSR